MDFHPLADVFPLMEGDEFAAHAADIKANGQRCPIIIYEGKILDGRNRWRACQEIGVEPRIEKLNSHLDPFDFVVSMNLSRRQLTKKQAAWAAAQIANMRHGGDRKSDQSAKLHLDKTSLEDAAKKFGVARRSVAAAAFIAKHGDEKDKAEASTANGQSHGKIVDRIRKRTSPPEQRAAKNEKAREKRARGRNSKTIVKTVVMAAQSLEQAARVLEEIESIPDLGERKEHVFQDLKSARTNISRFIKRLGGEQDALTIQSGLDTPKTSVSHVARESASA